MPIFVNEHLTNHIASIHKKALELKRKNEIHQAWVRDGKVYIRNSEGDRPINITDLAQLENTTQDSKNEPEENLNQESDSEDEEQSDQVTDGEDDPNDKDSSHRAESSGQNPDQKPLTLSQLARKSTRAKTGTTSRV